LETQDYAKETSYFASYIKLTPEMNVRHAQTLHSRAMMSSVSFHLLLIVRLLQGMNIGIGPIKPWIVHPDRAFDGIHDSPASKFSHRTNDIFG